jgi:hypothetical protein
MSARDLSLGIERLLAEHEADVRRELADATRARLAEIVRSPEALALVRAWWQELGGEPLPKGSPWTACRACCLAVLAGGAGCVAHVPPRPDYLDALVVDLDGGKGGR